MLTRRRVVAAAVFWPLAPAALAETCGAVTARQTEGPFFKPSSPQRVTLIEPGSHAPRVAVSGRVLSRDCQPLKGVLLDFWHADEDGDYDNRGFRYRGHQFTDADGRWRLETIVPAVYPGRTRNIHVKVQPAGGRILTTQLYFPNEPQNERDGLFRRELVMRMSARDEGAFDFVLA
ncbi:MAG: intradiol ring-cleavage dioxygenase [Burkholderiales bacterium]